MQDWLPHRQEYLDELLRTEGLGSHNTLCLHCQARDGSVKCMDCFGGGLHCVKCTLEQHRFLPLHRVLVSRFSLTND